MEWRWFCKDIWWWWWKVKGDGNGEGLVWWNFGDYDEVGGEGGGRR